MLGLGLSRIFNRCSSVAGHQQKVAKRCLSKFYHIDDDLFGLTEEQKQLRQTAFQFSQEEIASKIQEIDKNDDFPGFRDFMKRCGDLGFLGVTCPVEYGGTGAGFMEHTLIAEEMARASCAVTLSCGAHSNLMLNQIVRNGTEQQKQKYLPVLCRGEKIGALAMSEASAGSDVVSMKTKAEKKGDYYVLNGTKFWITNGPIADWIIVYAKTDVSAKQHGVTAFIVEEGMEGFSRGVKLDKLGHRGSETGELILEDVKVPGSNVLGGENKGIYVLFSGLDIERIMFCSMAVGVLQACCDVAFEYAHERKQFGTEIAKFQLMQAKMAEMYATLQSCRSYLYNVVRALDKGRILSKDACAVLTLSGEQSVKQALDALQILGGNGFISDYPTGRLLRDAKLFTIGAGTTQIRQLVVGRAINDEYLK